MAYSYVNYTANGSTSNFTVPFPYIVKQDIHVSINEVQVDDEDISWVGDTIVSLPSNPANGAVVKVWRSTNKEALSTIYSTPNVIDHRDWNRVLTQLLYTTQEAYDLGITPFNDLQDAIANLQAMVNAAAGSADAANLYKTGAEAARDAALGYRNEAQTYAETASEIADFDPDLYLRVANKLAELSTVAAEARANIGALAEEDLPESLLTYDAQTLNGTQKAQARANIGAVGLTGDESIAGAKTFTGTPRFLSGTIRVDGYGGFGDSGVLVMNETQDRRLTFGPHASGSDAYVFEGAHVYSPAGRLLGTTDASSIVSSLRFANIGWAGLLDPSSNSEYSVGAVATAVRGSNALNINVHYRWLQMQIAGTWYTVSYL